MKCAFSFLDHMVKGLVLAQLHIALFLYVFNSGIHNAELFHSFGFTNEKVIQQQRECPESVLTAIFMCSLF